MSKSARASFAGTSPSNDGLIGSEPLLRTESLHGTSAAVRRAKQEVRALMHQSTGHTRNRLTLKLKFFERTGSGWI